MPERIVRRLVEHLQSLEVWMREYLSAHLTTVSSRVTHCIGELAREPCDELVHPCDGIEQLLRLTRLPIARFVMYDDLEARAFCRVQQRHKRAVALQEMLVTHDRSVLSLAALMPPPP